jgi:hypothetical protein
MLYPLSYGGDARKQRAGRRTNPPPGTLPDRPRSLGWPPVRPAPWGPKAPPTQPATTLAQFSGVLTASDGCGRWLSPGRALRR